MKLPFFIFLSCFAATVCSAQVGTPVRQAAVAETKEEVADAPYTRFDSSIYYTDTIIKWMSFEEALAAQKQNPKKIYVDIYATWCRWCRMTDSVVLKNREIAHYINQNYYAVKFNAETRTPVKFRDKNYVFIKDENVFAHELTVYLLNNKLSFPGTVFLDETGNIINSRNGYMEPDYFEVVLNYYAGNAYKNVSFFNYEFDFEGKVIME